MTVLILMRRAIVNPLLLIVITSMEVNLKLFYDSTGIFTREMLCFISKEI